MSTGRLDYQRLVEEVATLLGAPATLEDRDFTLVAFAAHEDEAGGDLALDDVRARSILSRRSAPQVKAWFESFGIARATGPVRIPADPATGTRARLCLPARHRGVTYGYIWLVEPDQGAGWSDADVAAAFALAGQAGDLLAEEAAAGTELGESLREVLHGADESGRAAAALTGAGAVSGAFAVIVLWDTREALPDPAAVHAMPHVVASYLELSYGTKDLVALVRGARPAGEAARRLVRGRRAASAGVSASAADLTSGPALLGQARAAVRTAAAFPARGPVAEWAEMGAYRLIAALPAAADPVVAVLLEPQHGELARTAEVYLDHAAHATQAARVLAIHRQTLYYRLSRVEQLTGLDLADGEDRLLLHMALKAARLGGV